MLVYMIFQYSREPDFIHRIVNGFKTIQEKKFLLCIIFSPALLLNVGQNLDASQHTKKDKCC